MNKIYNPEIKERFLSRYEENSRNAVKRVFFKSCSAEELLEKDLYNFTKEEIEKVLYNLNPHSVDVAKSLGNYISSYISWAIRSEGLRRSNLNPLDSVDDSYYEKFVDKSKKVHWSDEELIELLKELNNPQDQALIILMFNGVVGENFSEIKELTFDDINWSNRTIHIRSRNYTLTLFNEKGIEILEKAYDQRLYTTFNEETLYRETELIDSGYILKNLVSKRINTPQPVTSAVIYNRLASIKKQLNLDYFTPNAIKQSGMIKMAVDLWHQYGKLEKEEFALIGERFNLTKMRTEGYEYYNRSAMKNYINEKNIKTLYGLDVVID